MLYKNKSTNQNSKFTNKPNFWKKKKKSARKVLYFP